MRKSLFLVAAILAISTAAAAGLQLNQYYGPGETLSGKLVFNTSTVLANENFSASVSGANMGSISLLDFLENSGSSFSCTTANCTSRLDSNSPLQSRSAANSYIALTIPSGKNVTITQITFNMSGSYNQKSCGIIPAKLDFFDDGTIDWQYMEPDNDFCNQLSASDYYNDSAASYSYEIVSEPYCEKIKLGIAKKFKLGADIRKGNLAAELTMFISDGSDTSEPCTLNLASGLQTCEVNFTAVKSDYYYVCIQSDIESDTMIKGELQRPGCGNFGFSAYSCNTSVDYALYAQQSFFKPFTEKIEFDDDLFEEINGQSLGVSVQNYIDENYGADCSSKCVIPIKAISNQTITFSDLTFRYSTDIGARTEKNFYLLEKSPALVNITSNSIELLYAGFELPTKLGNYTLLLKIGNNDLARGTVSIKPVPIIQDLRPTSVSAATSTKFSILVYSPQNNMIKSYDWDFGDGDSQTTSDSFVDHIYSLGNFTLTIKVTDSAGLSNQRSYAIISQEPKEIINLTLAKKKSNLENFRLELNSIPDWYANIIKDIIDIDTTESALSELSQAFQGANPDYVAIKQELDGIFAPSMITESQFETPMHSQPDAAYIEAIDNSIASDETINEKIKLWNEANIDITSFSTEKSAVEGTESTGLATELNVKIKGTGLEGDYLIIKSPVAITFKENYSELSRQNVDGAAGFILNSDETEIDFAVPGVHSASEFLIFASPPLSFFETEIGAVCGDGFCDKLREESFSTCSADCPRPYGTAIMWVIIVILIVGAGIFFIWRYYASLYDQKLRDKLFSQDDFNKISFFIANEMNKGKADKEIREELEKAEWKPSQIDYALQKVKAQTKMMQKKSAAAFIRKELRSGKQEQDIRKELLDAGWKSSIIGYGFKKAKEAK